MVAAMNRDAGLEVSLAKPVVLKDASPEWSAALEYKSLALSRTIPRTSATASDEKVCWYETMPMVSKLSAVWRWPAACCTCSFGNLVARELVANDQAQAVPWRKVALVVDGKIAQLCRVFVKFSGTTGFR